MMRGAILVAALCCACSAAEPTAAKGTAPLGCAELGGPDDCYAAFVAKVDACLGGKTVSATFQSDLASCGTATDGVVFQTTAMGAAQHFTVTANGRTCLEWTREEGSRDFVAVSETATLQRSGNTVICPDGRTFSLAEPALLSCPEKVPGGRYDVTQTTAADSPVKSQYVQFVLNGSAQPQLKCTWDSGGGWDGWGDGGGYGP